MGQHRCAVELGLAPDSVDIVNMGHALLTSPVPANTMLSPVLSHIRTGEGESLNAWQR